MQRNPALAAALTMMQHPALSKSARNAPLPDGMTLLLEVAAGDVEAAERAATMTGQPLHVVRFASSFFIEQVLFGRTADSYRILGSRPGDSTSELRRHMALLMRWTHPDIINQDEPNHDVDRSVFAGRITRAWEDLKTVEREENYGKQRHAALNVAGPQRSRSSPGRSRGNDGRGHPNYALRASNPEPSRAARFQSDSLWGRLVRYFRGHE
jgi:hypothetical protein